MIYPSTISNDKRNNAEFRVFKALKSLPDEDYTVFYNQEFVSDSLSKEKLQYEIDFVLAYHPSSIFLGLLVLEVKGGRISYDGVKDNWYQSSRYMVKSPVTQVTGSMHSFLKRYSNLLKNVNVSWALCFPDTEVTTYDSLPTNLTRIKIFDNTDLKEIDSKLINFFEDSGMKIGKSGESFLSFEKLKNELLKGCDLYKPLNSEIKENNQIFLKLTEQQSKIVRFLKGNDNFCIEGPAGSGKTLIAYQQALEFKRQGLKVLYVTFNKQIANHLRNLFRNEMQVSDEEGRLEITNFHFWASRIAEKNPCYQKEKSSDDFFNTYIPNKALEVVENDIYDVLIIDEGQDFKPNWLELLNKTLKKDGKFMIFLDENQNIFNAFKGVPHHRNIVKLSLEENCRNTIKIIDFLNDIIKDCNMIPMENSPEGPDVILKSFVTNDEQINFLDKEICELITRHKVSAGDIMILTNNVDGASSLKGVKTLGGMDLKSPYDKEFGRSKEFIFHSTINVFKGLESEIVFIIDAQNIFEDQKAFYTQSSRAKNKLYINYLN